MNGGEALDWLRLAWEAAFAVAVVLVGIYSRQIAGLKRENSERAGEISDLRVDFAALEARCLKSEDLTNVHKRVDALTKEVHSMGGIVKSMNGTLQTMQQHLLDKGGGR